MIEYRKINSGCLRIGERIKKARKEKGLTIKELANKTELSPGFISKAERSVHTPSLTTLQKIANVLEVPISYFFSDSKSGVTIVRKNKEVIIQNPGSPLKHKVLSVGLPRVAVLLVNVLPGQSSGKKAFIHEGFECNFVVEGKIKFYVDGAEHTLTAGESINFNSGLCHGFKNVGKETATLLTCHFFL